MKQCLRSLYSYNKNTFPVLACCIFISLFLPFLFTIPYLDGNIDFVQSYDFYTGGFQRYFYQWGSVHPPLKLWLTDMLYYIFGIHTFSYNLVGPVFGLVGIFAIFGLAKTISNKSIAQISAILL